MSARVAYFGSPHVGGPHSVFRALRAALQDTRFELRWLSWAPPGHIDASGDSPGEFLPVPEGTDAPGRIALLAAHLRRAGYSGVVVNVLGDPLLTCAARYLPADLRRIMFVHSTSRGTYAAARAIREHVDRVVAVSPRIRDDLLSRHGFSAEHVACIPNAVLEAGGPRACGRREGPLRLAYLGRLDDSSKGVMEIPRIMRSAAAPGVSIDLIGAGPDEERLRAALAASGVAFRLLGALAHEQVPEALRRYDVLLCPSRYEGFGIAIAEAMAQGVVPVATRIAGVTDFIVGEGTEGLLFPLGDAGAAARAIDRLAADEGLLQRLSRNAALKARERFSLEAVGPRYRELFERAWSEPRRALAPLDPAHFHLPRGLRPAISTRFPEWLKIRLRHVAERLRH